MIRYLSDLYVLLTFTCAVIVYASWRRRLKIHDPWGALALGVIWPLVLPMIFVGWLRGTKGP